MKDGMGIFALFFFEKGCCVRDLSVSDFHRKEAENPFPAFDFEPESSVGQLNLERIYTENQTGKEMPLMRVSGKIEKLNSRIIFTENDPFIVGSGEITEKNCL